MVLLPCSKCGVHPDIKVCPASLGDPNLWVVLPNCKCEHKLYSFENKEEAVNRWNKENFYESNRQS